ncbi:hypothetical protein ZWY2020_037402 [Hordeum vulgare]|nr:hypothetical protein ZWY2020_037402 [Hordeum vulgare]
MLAAESASLGANGTLHVVAQCAPWNVTVAGCAACLSRSVRDVPDEDRLIGGVRRSMGSVHRYNCNLWFEISAPVPPPMGKGAMAAMTTTGSSRCCPSPFPCFSAPAVRRPRLHGLLSRAR